MNLETEANLQAEFYHACRLIHLPVALEVNTPAGRVDCMILSKDRLMMLVIVEVKDSLSAFVGGNSLQIQRYKTLGVPVYGLCPRNCPHKLAATIQRKHTYPDGVLLSSFAGQESYVRKFRAERRAEKEQARLQRKLNHYLSNGLIDRTLAKCQMLRAGTKPTPEPLLATTSTNDLTSTSVSSTHSC